MLLVMTYGIHLFSGIGRVHWRSGFGGTHWFSGIDGVAGKALTLHVGRE